jgi:hypothetical protein
MVDACLISAVSTLSEFDEVANGKQTWCRFYRTSRKRSLSLVVVDVVYVLLLTSLHHARTFHFTSDIYITRLLSCCLLQSHQQKTEGVSLYIARAC